jgi:hypothetical protein
MTKNLAYFISFILNPLFILVFLPYFLVFKATGSVADAVGWTSYSFIFLLAVGVFMVHGVRKRFFSDLDVSNRSQRPILFSFLIATGVIYILGLYLMFAPSILKVMAIGMMIGLVIVSVVNRWIKASIHLAILSALLLGVVLGYGGRSFLLFSLIPLVAWSRVKIKRHTLPETIIGSGIGIVVSLGIYTYLRTFIYS